jgi:DHA1 family bicyclomycin/chloramphenicol resistance-like MFS transporter
MSALMTAAAALDTPDPTTAGTPWGIVILLGALTALGAVSVDMYLPSLPAIGRDFHAPSGAAQATLASFFTGLAIGQFFYGPASDRWGRRWPLLVGVAVYVAASVGCVVAPSLEALIAARFFQGLGGCAGQVIARAVVRDRFAHRQGAQILSRLMLIMGIAPILAPLAGGALLGLGGWRVIFWVMTGFGGVIAVWMFFGLAETRSAATAAQARAEHPLRAYLALTRSRTLMGYVLAGAFNSAALFAYIAASPGLLIQTYHIPPSAFGWVFGGNAVGLIAMSQVNAHLLRHRTPEDILNRARPVSILFAVALAVCAFTGFGGEWGVLIPLFLVISSFGFVGANSQSAGLNVDPLRAGSISALMGGASFGAGAVVSAMTTALTTAFPGQGARPMAVVILIAILASTAALYTLAQPGKTVGELA